MATDNDKDRKIQELQQVCDSFVAAKGTKPFRDESTIDLLKGTIINKCHRTIKFLGNEEGLKKLCNKALALLLEKKGESIEDWSEAKRNLWYMQYHEVLSEFHNKKRQKVNQDIRVAILSILENENQQFQPTEEEEVEVEIDGKKVKKMVKLPGKLPTSKEFEAVVLRYVLFAH